MQRHHLIMHASRLVTLSKIGEAVQNIARASEAAGGVAPMQIGTVKGKGNEGEDVKGKCRRELVRAEKEKDDAKKLAAKNKDKQCFYCQKKGHVKNGCRNRQRDMKKAKDSDGPIVDSKQTETDTDGDVTSPVVVGIPTMASSSHDYVIAVTEKSHVWASTLSEGRGWLFSRFNSSWCKSQCQRFKKTMYVGASLTRDQQ